MPFRMPCALWAKKKIRVVGVNASCVIREAAIVPSRMSTATATNRPVRGSSPSNRLSCSEKMLMARTLLEVKSAVCAKIRELRQVGCQVQRSSERVLSVVGPVECEHLASLLAAQTIEQRIVDHDPGSVEHGTHEGAEPLLETAEMIGKGRAQRFEARAGDAEFREHARRALLQLTVL